jgi:PAS domain S-box-containing protein
MSHWAGGTGDVRSLFADLPVLFVLTRAEDGRAIITDCNDRFAERLGYDREGVLGRPLCDLYAPDSAADLDERYSETLADEFTTAERDLLCADGTVVHTRVRAVPRTDDDGGVVGTRALFVDVTRREQHRRQAAILNRLLRHNLRNDMTVVLNHASALAEELDDTERDSARAILKIAQRWDRLVRKVQQIRRVVSPADDWTPTDLAAVLERIEASFDDRYPDATVEVLRPDDGAAVVRPEIELAITELCENAIRHADDVDPNVLVTVSLPSDDDWVTLTVADDGPPIPESELVPLGEDEATPLLHATGLGLWMVRLAVDRVGGTVSVVDNDDDGTAVTIRYPA